MSNTISEGEIVIKDELPEAEPNKTFNLRSREQKIDEIKQETKLTNEVVLKIEENKLERFEISLVEEKAPNQTPSKPNQIPAPSRKEHVIFVVPPLQSRDATVGTFHTKG
jgi:hypothetical protein